MAEIAISGYWIAAACMEAVKCVAGAVHEALMALRAMSAVVLCWIVVALVCCGLHYQEHGRYE